jgi:glucose-1-phosphate cytidylyltransferase
VPIGDRPILWHIMKYYASYGHKEFILCLGWKANTIKDYFINYEESVSNDFVLRKGGDIELLNTDIDDWTITFVDTGLSSNIGQRLKAVRPHLDGDDVFLANYADGLSDLYLPTLIDFFLEKNSVATCLGVKPALSSHFVASDSHGTVTQIVPCTETNIRINGGFFVFRNQIFDYIKGGEELVVEPFHRLIAERRLSIYNYDGFWACMDTYKEKQLLDDIYNLGNPPWEVTEHELPNSSARDDSSPAPQLAPNPSRNAFPDSIFIPQV